MNLKTSIPLCAAVLITFVALAHAQDAPPADAKPPIKQEELGSILAPIALYPDSLLSQVFMASTYPLEIVEADRWVKANSNLKGDALAKELEKQTWDASVKSLVNFPDVLSTMSEKLDITMKIGDAFIDDQTRVMNTVQDLRAKAQAAGNLKTNEQQNVSVEPAPAAPAPVQQSTNVVVEQAPAPTQIIKIESPSPQTVYVPTYNPTTVYGTYPYPAYPPPPYYPPRPPGYVASNMISFGVGVACGAAWGYAWGGCNWGHGDVDIDVNRNTNFNTNIDRSKAQANIDARRTNVQGGNKNSFQHDPQHRKGAPYSSSKTAQKYGGTQNAKAAQAREQYRGRSDAGAKDLKTAGAGQNRAGAGAADRAGAGQNRAGAGGAGTANRTGAGAADRAGAGQNRAGAGGAGVQDRAGAGGADRAGGGGASANRAGAGQDRSGPAGARNTTPTQSGARDTGKSSAMSGVDRGGSGARADSQRGQASRSASPSPKAGGGSSRSGGGGGGGGARGGGGGGGGRR
jgi:hypothetical protein